MPLATPDDATTFCTGAVTSTSCVRRSVFTLNVCMGCSRYLVATASLPESDLLVLRKMNDEVTPHFPSRRKSLQFAKSACSPSRHKRQQAQFPFLHPFVRFLARCYICFIG